VLRIATERLQILQNSFLLSLPERTPLTAARSYGDFRNRPPGQASGFNPGQVRTGRDDWDAFEGPEAKQVAVSRDDVVGLGLKGAL